MNKIAFIVIFFISFSCFGDKIAPDTLKNYDVLIDFANNELTIEILNNCSTNTGFGDSLKSKVSNKIIDIVLGCACGLKIGYYSLPVTSVKLADKKDAYLDIEEIAELCCTFESLCELLNNKGIITISYLKEKNIWHIKKEKEYKR